MSITCKMNKTTILTTTAFAVLAFGAFNQAGAQQSGEQGGIFERMDKNDDGKISQEEVKDNAMKRFEDIDANGDGKVTDADIEQRIERIREENSDIPDERFDRQKKVLEAQLKRLDKNGDGKVTDDEYKDSALSRHENLDRNDDGMVTEEEIKKTREEMRQKMQQQRQQQKKGQKPQQSGN